jgi:hypothetical protein
VGEIHHFFPEGSKKRGQVGAETSVAPEDSHRFSAVISRAEAQYTGLAFKINTKYTKK